MSCLGDPGDEPGYSYHPTPEWLKWLLAFLIVGVLAACMIPVFSGYAGRYDCEADRVYLEEIALCQNDRSCTYSRHEQQKALDTVKRYVLNCRNAP